MSLQKASPEVVRTIGHSTRSLEEFRQLLETYKVDRIIDIRTVPRSRKNLQYNLETLPAALDKYHIGYEHLKGLGGLRHPLKESLNGGWRNASFRGFADYMQTEEFEQNLNLLIDISQKKLVAIMCAEAVPWRCHRSLIADALTVRGFPVEHIISRTSHYPHKLTPWARVEGLRITYPQPESSADSD